MSRSLLCVVESTWRGLGSPGVVVAVSGGADSVALARALAAIGAAPLVLAHLNHQLRGGASDADEAFVADLAEQMNVPFVARRLDLAALVARQGGNLEATARDERYRWLADVAAAHQLHHVATGHTANDQAETVLHRLLRGTGIDGLRGIAPRRELAPGVELVRPLLAVSRAEVVAFLEAIGQPWRHDATNDDPRFTRNRIRRELVPLLERDYNPRLIEALARLAAQAGEIAVDEQRQANDLLARAELPRAAGRVILDARVLRAAPRRLVRAALRLVWRREGWPMDGLGHVEHERLADLVEAETGAHDLPGGVHARRRGPVLQLGRAISHPA